MSKDLKLEQRIEDFKQYLRRSEEEHLKSLLEIAEIQLEHPDHANRCWAGTSHQAPFLNVWTVLKEEKKRRGIK